MSAQEPGVPGLARVVEATFLMGGGGGEEKGGLSPGSSLPSRGHLGALVCTKHVKFAAKARGPPALSLTCLALHSVLSSQTTGPEWG